MTKSKPNILLIVTEHHRGDWTEFNPNISVKTPFIKKYGEKGAYFNNAICPSPLCVPSRVCLGSGKKYDNCDIIDNHQCYPLDHTSFYKLLRDEGGYHTMMCGKFDFNKPLKSWGRHGKQIVDGKNYMKLWGFSDGIDNEGKMDATQGYRAGTPGPYIDYLENKGLAKEHVKDLRSRGYTGCEPCPLSDEEYADNRIGRQGIKLMERAPEDKPWFLQVNFNGAHNPWDITKTMKKKYEDIQFPKPFKCYRFRKKTINEIRQNYSAMIENLDGWLGKYIDYLKENDKFENTIIAFTADHGEMLGDHNHVRKRFPLQPSINVPLMIYTPSMKKMGELSYPVETLDLTATFLDYAGVSVPDYMDSKSMREYLEGKKEDPPRKFVTSGFYGWRAILDGKYKLITGFKESWMGRLLNRKFPNTYKSKTRLESPVSLYDLENDPIESKNIAEKNPVIVQKLTEKLEKNLT